MRKTGFPALVFLVLLTLWCCGQDRKTSEALPRADADQSAHSVLPEAAGPGTATESSGEHASIRFEQTTFDFGESEPGNNIEHVYPFKNVGNATLVIEKVESS
jgi:hypothetical protein